MKAIDIAKVRLDKNGIQMPRLEAEMLAAHVLGCERHHLYIDRELSMNAEQVEVFGQMVEDRCLGRPIQYIIGYREFMGLEFRVDENVLIPRPDTEVLVESALERLPVDRHIRVLDIGTGSGAIGISIAHYRANSTVLATDISEGALSIARQNAKTHGVEDRIEFLKGDMFSTLGDQLKGRFDTIVSNPPYIPTDDIDRLSVDVSRYEPRSALDGGGDGLHFYRQIAHRGHLYLHGGGFIGLEVGHDQAPGVTEILQDSGCYSHICSIEDLSGIKRVVIAYKSKGKKE